MAHDNNPKKNTPEYLEHQRGLVSNADRRRDSLPEIEFVHWLVTMSSNNVLREDDDYYRAHEEQHVAASKYRPTCLLDCLFDWLNQWQSRTSAESKYVGGLLFIDSYEEWLLMVMSVMDQVHRGVLFDRASIGDWTIDELAVAGEGLRSSGRFDDFDWLLDLGAMEFFERPLDRSHPALDRHRFEHLRAQSLRHRD